MVFKCQEDSFLTEYTSTVLRCEPTSEPIVEYGKEQEFEGYKVTLEDTILFPAGGGQPHDVGFLNDVEVYQVIRKGNEAIHFTKEPLEIGTTVDQKIDWDRRFDHMQQHSGQHLLSAILEREHKIPTSSWWLGEKECHVEVDSDAVKSELLDTLEAKCNEYIRQAVPVEVKFCKPGDLGMDEAHTRGLPEDCVDTIRIIKMGPIDQNMCCGTHVSNLSQLQVMKLTGLENGKKGKSNLKFLVGNRVTTAMQLLFDREKSITELLNNEPARHVELIKKLQRNLKVAKKSLENVLQELAQHEVNKIKSTIPKPVYIVMFKKEATPEFNRAVMKGLEGEKMLVLLASEDPDRPREGQIMIQGPEEHLSALGHRITRMLKGKGAFKHGRFQGKAGDLGAMNECNKLIEDYFNNLQ